MSVPSTDRIVTEALAKSGLLWVTSPAGSAPVWHAPVELVAYVLYGPGEQFSPEHSGRVDVVARSKESRARLLTFAADASIVRPDDDDWETATSALVAGRLNLPVGDPIPRWRDTCTILRLLPDLSTVIMRGNQLASAAVPEAPSGEPTGDDPDDAQASLRDGAAQLSGSSGSGSAPGDAARTPSPKEAENL